MTSTPRALELQRNRRNAFVARGLTIYGTPRKNYRWPQLDGLPPRQRMNERIRICTMRARRENKAMAIESGSRPKRMSRWQFENKVLRAEIETVVSEIAAVFDDLSPRAKAACIAISITLGSIKRKFEAARSRGSNLRQGP